MAVPDQACPGQSISTLATVEALPWSIKILELGRLGKGGHLHAQLMLWRCPLQGYGKAQQDNIGWQWFLKGMVLVKIDDISSLINRFTGLAGVDKWATGLIIKLLELTHRQWLYRNVVVHGQEVEGNPAIRD